MDPHTDEYHRQMAEAAQLLARDGQTYQRGRPGRIDLAEGNGLSERRSVVNGAESKIQLDPAGKLPGSVWSVPDELSCVDWHDDDTATVWWLASEPLKVPPIFYSADGGRTWDVATSKSKKNATKERQRLWAMAEHAWAQGRPFLLSQVEHFAAFPQEWPRRFVLGWSPPGICLECGEGRRPVVDRRFDGEPNLAEGARQRERVATMSGGTESVTLGRTDLVRRTIMGYACACTPFTDHPATPASAPDREPGHAEATKPAIGASSALLTGGRQMAELGPPERTGAWREWHLAGWVPPPTRPAVVLDPFSGTGTVAGVARALGRHGVGLDLSRDYNRLATWRIFSSGHFTRSAARSAAEAQGVLL